MKKYKVEATSTASGIWYTVYTSDDNGVTSKNFHANQGRNERVNGIKTFAKHTQTPRERAEAYINELENRGYEREVSQSERDLGEILELIKDRDPVEKRKTLETVLKNFPLKS